MSDLRAINDALADMGTLWSMSTTSKPAPNLSKTNYTRSTRLANLVEAAPKGRISRFEIESQLCDQKLNLTFGGRSSRFTLLTFEGQGSELPARFRDISSILLQAEKMGRKWHRLAVAISLTIGIFVPLTIFDHVSKLGLFYEEPGPHGNIGAAAGLSVFWLIILGPLATGIWSWLTMSSVTLRPFINTVSIFDRAANAPVRAVKWVVSLYKVDELAEKRKQLEGTITWACAAAGVIVMVLAWLFPR